MARTTTSIVSVDLSFARTETGTNQTVTEQSNTKLSSSLSQGTAAAQINAAWRGTGVIATSGQLLLNLESLDRKVFGSSQTVDFVGGDIKSIVIANTSSSALKRFNIQATGLTPLKGIFNGTGNYVVYGQGAFTFMNLSGLPITSGNKKIQIHDSKSGST